MGKYELGDKVEVHGLPELGTESHLNGSIGIVVALPGYNNLSPLAYGVRFDSGPSVGSTLPAIDKFLRPFPPKLPNGRGDVDKKTTWAEFDAMTGLRSRSFREGYDASPAT